MKINIDEMAQPTDFLVKSALIITALVAILLTPFTINNFIQERNVLGTGTSIIVILCAINTWNCARDRYQPLIILLCLVPCVIFFLIYAFRDLGLIGALWAYPATLSFYFMLPERYAWIANTFLFGLVLPEAWSIFEPPVAIRFAATLLATSIFAGVFIRFITKQQIKLELMVATDPLTGLYNRIQLDRELEKALQQSHRTGSPMSLLMIDIDSFKEINDAFGHHAGDKVLKDMGSYFQECIRSSDTIFRIGGDELVILLYNTDAKDALATAEMMCKGITTLPLLPNKTVTVSIGVAELLPKDQLSDWMRRSDKNLYLAKSNGRNQSSSD